MDKPKFVYTVRIATTPERLWAALISNEFWQRFSGPIESDWKVGSPVKFFLPDGKLYSAGVILKSNPPLTLSHTWPDPEAAGNADPAQRLTWKIEKIDPENVKLTMLHEHMTEAAFQGVSKGWPTILDGLKGELETSGVPLP